MHFDILTQELPETVNIKGIDYPINSDFRVGIRVESIIRSDDSENDKYMKMLHLYYPQIPTDIVTAVEKIIWFYRCGEDMEEEDDTTRQRYQHRRNKEPACVFTQDSPYIYAAFLEQYGIDLAEVKYMHWWKFMALFESIGDSTKISRIMYYRKASTSGMSKENRAFINEMKKLYKIRTGNSSRLTLEQRNQNWKDYVRKRQGQG